MKAIVKVLAASAVLAFQLVSHAAQAEAPAIAPNSAGASADNSNVVTDPMKAAMQAEMERQLYLGMVAVREYCKTTDAENAKTYDASWDKTTETAPAELKAGASAQEFVAKVAEKAKEYQALVVHPDKAAELQGACASMLAGK